MVVGLLYVPIMKNGILRFSWYKLKKINPRTHCAGLSNSKLFFVKNTFDKIVSFKRLIDGNAARSRQFVTTKIITNTKH